MGSESGHSHQCMRACENVGIFTPAGLRDGGRPGWDSKQGTSGERLGCFLQLL